MDCSRGGPSRGGCLQSSGLTWQASEVILTLAVVLARTPMTLDGRPWYYSNIPWPTRYSNRQRLGVRGTRSAPSLTGGSPRSWEKGVSIMVWKTYLVVTVAPTFYRIGHRTWDCWKCGPSPLGLSLRAITQTPVLVSSQESIRPTALAVRCQS